MFNRLARHTADMNSQLGDLRRELALMSQRIDGLGDEAVRLRNDVERLKADVIEPLVRRADRTEQRADEEDARHSMTSDAISSLNQRIEAIEEQAGPEQAEAVDRALAALRTAVARMERQIELQREDAGRVATGLIERIEDLRRRI